jgi:mannose-6-phosphate isomerase-like protein (cupin superfamily)
MFQVGMNVKNIREARDWFAVLQTEPRTQTAVMTLKPGQSSGSEPEAHKNSTQVLLVLSGEVLAEVEGERKKLSEGDVIVIPAGVRHKFTNDRSSDCVTFNTYSPPEY